MARHAEIAGAGIGGLGLGIMLARRGWSVRVHERSPAIREIGSGISLRNNCIEVLEHYGIFPRLEPHGTMLRLERHFDWRGRFVQQRSLTGHHRTLVLPRQTLVDVLADAARDAGIEIVTNSPIAGAETSGALIGADGRRHPADLAVGADGIRSHIRGSLPIGARFDEYPARVNRYLLPFSAFAEPATMFEIWSGDRRVGIMPSGPGKTFIYAVMPTRDRAACAMPLDAKNWSSAFPRLVELFETVSAVEGSQFTYPLVTAPRWSCGRVALVGDAAHGMPPTLGQGVGLAMMNCHALAELVTVDADVERALERWENTMRFLSDATRLWAIRYDRVTRRWPRPLRVLRPRVIWAIGRIRFLNERMRIADRGLALTEIGLQRP